MERRFFADILGFWGWYEIQVGGGADILKIYGLVMCENSVACVEKLTEKGIQFEFLDFTKDLRCFKEFMQLRDMSPLFDEVKKAGGIGMSKSIENNEVYEKDSM